MGKQQARGQTWDLIQEMQLTDQEGWFTWKWTASAEFTTKSAYMAQLVQKVILFISSI
jgi:hypothetical protein